MKSSAIYPLAMAENQLSYPGCCEYKRDAAITFI